MGFLEAFKYNLVKPFEGRASRSEFWWFILWIFIVFFVPYFLIFASIFSLQGIDFNSPESTRVLEGGGLASGLGLVMIAWIFLIEWMIVASLCTAIRRLHDTNKSGWWFFIGFIPILGWIVMIVLYCIPGNAGENRFGDDPLNKLDADVF